MSNIAISNRQLKQRINSTRKDLFKSIKNISPLFEIQVKEILYKKIESENGKPRLFEILPWLYQDIVKLDDSIVKDIAKNWLALYLYVSFVDDCVDNHNTINIKNILGASLLAQTGLINLFKIVQGTEYEAIFNKALHDSVKGESLDLIQNSNWKPTKEKLNSIIGKNKILLTCAVAFTASLPEKSNILIDITNKILSLTQQLDDLTDHIPDYENKNYTMLLSHPYFQEDGLSNEQLLEKLIVCGTLKSTVNDICSTLNELSIFMKANNCDNNLFSTFVSKTNSKIQKLRRCLESTIILNEEIQNKEIAITKINRYLNDIYMHT